MTNKLTPTKQFERIVRRMRNQMEQLEALVCWEDLVAERWPSDPQLDVVDGVIGHLLVLDQSLRKLRQVWVSSGITVLTGVNERDRSYYEEVIRPRRQQLANISMNILEHKITKDLEPDNDHGEGNGDAEWNDMDQMKDGTGEAGSERLSGLEKPSGPVKEAMKEGIDQRWELIDEQGPANYALESAYAVVNAPWFRPDEWIDTSGSLEPVKIARRTAVIHGSIKKRVYELYRVTVLGQYVAAIALARSVVECGLRERAGFWLKALGDREVEAVRNRGKRGMSLEGMLERYRRAGVNLPFDELYERVKKPADQVLHDSGARIEPEMAVSCVDCTGRIIEKLYLDR